MTVLLYDYFHDAFSDMVTCLFLSAHLCSVEKNFCLEQNEGESIITAFLFGVYCPFKDKHTPVC